MRYESRIRTVEGYMARLRSNEYLYTGDETTEKLVCLIYNVIYSLSRVNAAEWASFLAMFRDAKFKALAHTNIDREKTENYNSAVSLLLVAFEKYILYLRSVDEPVAHQVTATS